MVSLEENIREFYSPECIEMILKCGEKLKKDPRLIDADALKEGYEYMGYDATEHPEGSYMEGWCNGFNAAVHHCIHHVIHAPSVEAEPVRHGRWIADNRCGGGYWVCSVCKHPTEAFAAKQLYAFCPFCGATMDEVEQDG